MCRFNLAAGFAETAPGYGPLGLVAVFSWLRYCQTRQLNWNVNYNVKPRWAPCPAPQGQGRLSSLTSLLARVHLPVSLWLWVLSSFYPPRWFSPQNMQSFRETAGADAASLVLSFLTSFGQSERAGS